ncbi:hypothetical protein XELAEV_18006163mg [Xenopus laevis]|uniref:Uncharacterized protein n=1 Tax=Xenopus laevis TaxID=8355 RepID=A0A974DYT1_XENLA|nr:hypothetical protein XELAEV_18006163mg [Xenopus laevis]
MGHSLPLIQRFIDNGFTMDPIPVLSINRRLHPIILELKCTAVPYFFKCLLVTYWGLESWLEQSFVLLLYFIQRESSKNKRVEFPFRFVLNEKERLFIYIPWIISLEQYSRVNVPVNRSESVGEEDIVHVAKLVLNANRMFFSVSSNIQKCQHNKVNHIGMTVINKLYYIAECIIKGAFWK